MAVSSQREVAEPRRRREAHQTHRAGAAPRTPSFAQARGSLARPRMLRVRPASSMPAAPLWQRVVKHRLFSHYNRLIVLVLAANVVVALTNAFDDDLAVTAVLVNLAAAVLIRQRLVVNALFAAATALPQSTPLRVRQLSGKVYQFGGIHAGAAIASTTWFVAHVVLVERAGVWRDDFLQFLSFALTVAVLALLVLIVLCAAPVVRSKWHNVFELSHRLGGWGALLLLWGQTGVAACVDGGGAFSALAMVSSGQFWVLLLVTACVAEPWTRLRRVPVTMRKPSSHIAVLEFGSEHRPFHGSTSGISVNPLREWHTFASVDAPDREVSRMFVSRAGDWTGRLVDDMPSSVWVKGGPVRSLPSVEKLFGKVLFFCTGSGIGPCMSGYKYRDDPQALVWVARAPRRTYGDELVDEILTMLPESIVIDTTEMGKPDMVELCYEAVKMFQADAVICVANKKVTWDVVSGLESRGVPAFGPVWDS